MFIYVRSLFYLMLSTRKKGEANASNVAVVVFLIALFLAIYILLLPPADRDALLNDNSTATTLPGEVVDDNGAVILLQQKPGMLKPLESDVAEHRIDPVNLYFKDEPIVSDLATSIVVKKSDFSEQTRKLSFNSDDLNDIQSANLFFSVDSGDGNLIITLNDVDVFDEKSEGLQNVVLPVEMLKESNILEFKVSSPGWNFIGRNEYSLRDLKVRQNLQLTNTKEERSFVLSSAEKGDGVLEYKLFCNSAGKNARLKITLNAREISNELLTCRSASREVEIANKDMKEGENKLIFQINEGDYLLNEIKLKVDSDTGGSVDYKFPITDDEFKQIEDGEKEAELTLEFSDKKQHQLTLELNGDEISVDTDEKNYLQDVTRFVDAGTNRIKIMPENEFDLVSLKIKLL